MSLPAGSGAFVTALMTKPVRHEPMQSRESVSAAARHGLTGDCHAQPLGPRQALIVRQEGLDRHGLGIWQVRANIAVRGLSVEALTSGSVLRIGDETHVRVTHECEVCKVLARYVPSETFKDLPGQRGSLGVFLTSGEISVGDAVAVRLGVYPEVPERIYERLAWLVARIPDGKVVTYAILIQLIGAARAYSRVLPTYLRRAADGGLPAHRVLTSSSTITGHMDQQAALLASEGVRLDDGGALLDPGQLWDARGVYFTRTSALPSRLAVATSHGDR
jgi:alkylated DNA nucleotide flippase Atl1